MRTVDAFSIGELAKRSGVKIETIRFYEKSGIMPSPARSSGGYRMYGPTHLKRLSFIRRGRQLGFGLDELRNLLRLVDGQAFSCAEVHALTLQHLAEVRSKIAALRRLERVMADMAAQCTDNLIPECPVIDALFEAQAIPETRLRGAKVRTASPP
jgi:MerR family mercuric resistance operon transcriptional regulator